MTGEDALEGHSHSFYRDGDDKRVVKVEVGIILSVVIFPDDCDNIGRRDIWERQVSRKGDSRYIGSCGCVDSIDSCEKD